MKKNFLRNLNLLLGALSLTLAGCHTQKKAAESTQNDQGEKPQIEQVQEGEVKCMYGVPAENYAEPAESHERPALKYGVPAPRDKRDKK